MVVEAEAAQASNAPLASTTTGMEVVEVDSIEILSDTITMTRTNGRIGLITWEVRRVKSKSKSGRTTFAKHGRPCHKESRISTSSTNLLKKTNGE